MIAALILAGGAGTRLGGADKAFVVLAGKPLIAHVLEKLYPQMTRMAQMSAPPCIAISANGDSARFAAYALPVLPDFPFTNIGPLAGIFAGLTWAKTIGAESLLTIPVDTPLFPGDFLARLTPAPAVATYHARQHHLCAHWPVSALQILGALLATENPKRVRDALSLLGARQVWFKATEDPFLNINTTDDLAAAERFANRTPE